MVHREFIFRLADHPIERVLILLWLPLASFAWQTGDPGFLVRSEARVVQINVSVKDKNGNAIPGLRKDDFAIFDNGKARPIQIFSNEPTLSAPGQPDPLKPGGPAARLTVIVLDGLNTEFMDQSYARAQALKAVQQMELNEMFAVLALNRDLNFQPFTRKRELLVAAIDRFRPNIPPYPMRQRIEVTLQALKTVAGKMSEAPGSKSIVWVTGGFPTIRYYSGAISRALDRINAMNVAIYPVDARGLTLGSGAASIRTLEQFADATGGEAYYNLNNLSTFIEKAAAASKVTYIIGFYLGPNDRDRASHTLKVEVNRPGVVPRYRRSYLMFP